MHNQSTYFRNTNNWQQGAIEFFRLDELEHGLWSMALEGEQLSHASFAVA